MHMRGIAACVIIILASCDSPTEPDVLPAHVGPVFRSGCDAGHNSGDCIAKAYEAGLATAGMLRACQAGFSYACGAGAVVAGVAWIRYDNGVDDFGHRHAEDCGFCTDPGPRAGGEDRDIWWSVRRVGP